MNTNPYSRLNNCAEWRIYKDLGTAYDNKSKKYFTLGFRIDDVIYCLGGTMECRSCYYFSLGNICSLPKICRELFILNNTTDRFAFLNNTKPVYDYIKYNYPEYLL